MLIFFSLKMNQKNSNSTPVNKSKSPKKSSTADGASGGRKNSMKPEKIQKDKSPKRKKNNSTSENGKFDRFSRERSFPQTKIRHIMECAPSDEEHKFSGEAVNAMARAAEAFAELLARGAHDYATQCGHKFIDYNDLSQSVQSNDKLTFIQDILPMKLKYSEVLKQMRKQRKRQMKMEQKRGGKSE